MTLQLSMGPSLLITVLTKEKVYTLRQLMNVDKDALPGSLDVNFEFLDSQLTNKRKRDFPRILPL